MKIIKLLMISLGLFVITITSSFSQASQVFNLKEDNLRSSSLDAQYDAYKVFSLNLVEFKKEMNKSMGNDIVLNFENWGRLEVNLEESAIFSEDIIISELVSTERKLKTVNNLPLTLKGETAFGKIRLTINNDYLNGFVETNQGMYYFDRLESSNAIENDKIVLIHQSDFKEEPVVNCHNNQQSNIDISKNQSNRSVGACYEIDLAIAIDFSLTDEQGGSENVIDHVLGVMNNVAANYEYSGTTNFDDGIEFNVVEIVVSLCTACDPWTTDTDVFKVLSNFSTWGRNLGFFEDHDMGQFWTDRDFDGGYVGLAEVGMNQICVNGVYHVLQDFTSSADFLRVMTSHEIGHNFGANHPAEINKIMSSSLSNTNDWNANTQLVISAEIASQGPSCLQSCLASPCAQVLDLEVSNITNTTFDLTWTAMSGESFDINIYEVESGDHIYFNSNLTGSLTVSDPDYETCKYYRAEVKKTCVGSLGAPTSLIFAAPQNMGCPDFCPDKNVSWSMGEVLFTDESINATTWYWEFGDGSNSTLQNPNHTYATDGFYDVSLMVNGLAVKEVDSLIAILPNRTLPYIPADGGSFDTAHDDFAPEGLNQTTNIWEKGIGTGFLASTDNVWKTILDDNVGKVDSEASLYTPRYDFTNTGTYVVKFNLGMQIQYCNGPLALQMQYSLDDGTTWTRLGSYGDSGSNIMGWYNRGPTAPCPISTAVFSDQTGWTFTHPGMQSSYDVSFLSGNSSVIFRFVMKVNPIFGAGFDVDGAMINNFEVTASGAVSLDLLDFSGANINGDNRLDWTIENMLNFNLFSLEKRTEGVSFEEIARIEGIENVKSYSYVDKNVSQQSSHYRLRMIDNDGQFSFSNTIQIDAEIQKAFSVYPNPNNSDFLNIDTSTPYTIFEIYNSVGQKVLSGEYSTKIAITNLQRGSYIIVLSSDSVKSIAEKFLIL